MSNLQGDGVFIISEKVQFKEVQKSRNVWLMFLAAPLTLAICFAPFILYFVEARGLSQSELIVEMTGIAWLPTSIGFGAILILTKYMAKKDGLALLDLGWEKPTWIDVVLGILIGLAISVVCIKLIYPILVNVDPSFDPELKKILLVLVIVMFSVATLSENTLYRSYALGVLTQRHGIYISLLLCSIFLLFVSSSSVMANGRFRIFTWAHSRNCPFVEKSYLDGSCLPFYGQY